MIRFSNFDETLPIQGNFRYTGHFSGPIGFSAAKLANENYSEMSVNMSFNVLINYFALGLKRLVSIFGGPRFQGAYIRKVLWVNR